MLQSTSGCLASLLSSQGEGETWERSPCAVFLPWRPLAEGALLVPLSQPQRAARQSWGALSRRRLGPRHRCFLEFSPPSGQSTAPAARQTARPGRACGRSSPGDVCRAGRGARQPEVLGRAAAWSCGMRGAMGRVLCPGLPRRGRRSAERWWHLPQDRLQFTLSSTGEAQDTESPGRGAEGETETGLVRRRECAAAGKAALSGGGGAEL